MALKSTAAKAPPPQKKDNRIHGTVYHKQDPRADNIIRHHKRSDIINLPDIKCVMLFRAETAHMQFDMLQNYRPYILFGGMAEGVFLPQSLGLLFPNACDQLDFRPDYEVPVSMTYALSDTEIAVLAGNGLFNGDWSCQGRLLGSVLEIPCKVDYYAVAHTPLTFIEIQDRLSMHTSTLQTGYKTLVSAFLPYQAQKHNLEQRPAIVHGPEFRLNESEIKRRAMQDPAPVGFGEGDGPRTMEDGASFVEVAQARIRTRLKDAMAEGDVLGTSKAAEKAAERDGEATADQVVAAVEAIRERQDSERERMIADAANMGREVKISDIDKKLDDMAMRMVYAGAGSIPVEAPPLAAKPLVKPAEPGKVPDKMGDPIVGPAPDAGDISDLDDKVRHAAQGAKATADAVLADLGNLKGMSRKERLAARRAAAAAMDKAAGGTSQDGGEKPAGQEEPEARAPAPQGDLAHDILSNDINIDDVVKGI